MRLVETGKIDLDAPAERYLQSWHLSPLEFDSNEVTVRRGLVDLFFPYLFALSTAADRLGGQLASRAGLDDRCAYGLRFGKRCQGFLPEIKAG